ncbi:VOC family protein [Bifidobacterium mongoliense]|nr:VOC family protein [Bifidobacterium mongoliense]
MKAPKKPEIDRSIYAMPMFVTFPTSDFALAQEIYGAAGFVTLATIPGPGGAPSLLHLRRERYQDILLVPGRAGDAPRHQVSIAADGIDLNDIASAMEDLDVEVAGPRDTPWFTTDLSFTDPDGNTVTLTAPRASEYQTAAAWASEHISGDYETAEGLDNASKSAVDGKDH